MAPLRIAVTGAGPAGCTLARVLTQKGFTVTVFEAEASINARAQGGTLDLRHEGGLRALKQAGLYDEFLKFARYDGEALIVADKNLKPWLKVGGPANGQNENRTSRPEIDRSQLRQMLFESLPPGTVHWGHKVQRVERRDNDSQYIKFADGSESGPYDLVVGADGAFSKARAAVTDVKPMYTGISYVAAVVPNAEKDHPELYKLVNRGSVFVYSDGKAATVQYLSDGSIHAGFAHVSSEDWLATVKGKDAPSLRAELQQLFADWAPLLKTIIGDAADDSFQTRGLYMLPIGHQWQHRTGFTLIGDAAHLMGPFAGEGVNLAMRDAVTLAEAIADVKDVHELDAAVERFEREMFVYMSEKQQLTWDNTQDMLFVPDAPRARIQEWVGRMAAAQFPPILRPVILWGSRIYYFFVKLIH